MQTAAIMLLSVGALKMKIVGQDPADGDLIRKGARELAAAAKNAYEQVVVGRQVGVFELSDVYVWSVRWLQASVRTAGDFEQRVAAYRDHRDRMIEQHSIVEEKWKIGGVAGGDEASYQAARYYLREAELWLAEAQHAKP